MMAAVTEKLGGERLLLEEVPPVREDRIVDTKV